MLTLYHTARENNKRSRHTAEKLMKRHKKPCSNTIFVHKFVLQCKVQNYLYE